MFPDLGPIGRRLFAACWIAGQGALIITGSKRPDGAFAFRMFPESSTIDVTLYRDVISQSGHGTERVRAVEGTWLARDTMGTLHRFRWDDRVKDGNLFPYGHPIHASYGADAQLARLQRALDDVASHIPDDNDTVRLVATVSVRKVGGAPYDVHLASAMRPQFGPHR